MLQNISDAPQKMINSCPWQDFFSPTFLLTYGKFADFFRDSCQHKFTNISSGQSCWIRTQIQLHYTAHSTMNPPHRHHLSIVIVILHLGQ